MGFTQAIELLDMIIKDRTVPRNIRKAAEDAKNALGENPTKLGISTAITILDEIINDPNMPIYARTKIWNAVSILEQIRRELKS